MSDSSPAAVVASRLRLLLRILDRQSGHDDQHLTKAGRALCPPAAFVPEPPDATQWDDLVTELGLIGLVRQRQRHTALTWMADAGVDLHIVQRAAGEQDPAVSAGYLLPDVQAMLNAETAFSAWCTVASPERRRSALSRVARMSVKCSSD